MTLWEMVVVVESVLRLPLSLSDPDPEMFMFTPNLSLKRLRNPRLAL